MKHSSMELLVQIWFSSNISFPAPPTNPLQSIYCMTIVRSAMTYGAEICAVKKSQENKFDVVDMRM